MQALTVFIHQALLSGIKSLTLGTVCKSVFIRMEEENSGPRLLALLKRIDNNYKNLCSKSNKNFDQITLYVAGSLLDQQI